MSKESCNICCDVYNKSTRDKICCNYCDFASCRTCCETYILSETIPKCMSPSCAKEWSKKFIRDKFTNTFINGKLKEHVENILFDQEKALLPATQPIVEEEIRKEKIKKEIREMDNLIQDLARQRKKLEHNLYNGKIPTRDASNFVRSCPADGCRGFLNNQWKCGICEQWSCPQCHELKGPNRDCEHTCDPNSVETAKLLDKETKPCPKCQSKIFKVSGCDQMWCTQCHTAFSWRTGAIEKNIHNPHYYEWQRKNGGLERAADDIECGRELDHRTSDAIYQLIRTKHKDLLLPASLTTKYNNYDSRIDRITNIIRNTIHLIRHELPQYRTDYVIKNQALRIQYLRNLISENEFKNTIQKNDKKNRKNNEIAQVIQLVNTAVTDIVFRFIDHLKKSSANKYDFAMMNEFDEIIKYCNEIFKDISYTYNSVCYSFDERMNMITIKKEVKKRASNKNVKKSGNSDSDSDSSSESESEYEIDADKKMKIITEKLSIFKMDIFKK